MILTCPECATRYQTDASHFTPDGRKVRCAKCGHVWFQPSPEPDAGVEDVAHVSPEPEPEPEPVAPKREAFAPSPRVEPVAQRFGERPHLFERLGIGFGWALLAAVVLGVLWSGISYRQSIADLWPQSSSLYAAMGMRVNTLGLEFRDKTAHYESEGDQPVLVITGHLLNTTSRELSVPAIRVSLMDQARRELYHWNFTPDVTTLAPGQLATFRTQMTGPPAGASNIELRFAAERAN
jgi:predicted Zn finger-like uncharacterized protein